MRKIVFGLLVLSIMAFPEAGYAGFINDHAATLVIGQSDFNSILKANAGEDEPNAFGLNNNNQCVPAVSDPATTGGVEILVIPDRENNRALVFRGRPTANKPRADYAIGQADLTSHGVNRGENFAAANTLNNPLGAAFSPLGQLVIVDRENFRILIWHTMPADGDVPADVVLGQPDFRSKDEPATSRSSVSVPDAAVCFGTKLLVADRGNSRVMIWNDIRPGHISNNQPADIVVGQPDFTSKEGNVVSASMLSNPRGVAVSPDGRLVVSSFTQSRVLIWNSIPTTNGAPADLVLGQPDFTTADQAWGSRGMSTVRGIAISRDGVLAVADNGNGRILIWNKVPTTSQAPAEKVLNARFPDESIINDYRRPEDDRNVRGLGLTFTIDGWLYLGDDFRTLLINPNDLRGHQEYTGPVTISPREIYIPLGQAVRFTAAGGTGGIRLWEGNGMAPMYYPGMPGAPTRQIGLDPATGEFWPGDAPTNYSTMSTVNIGGMPRQIFATDRDTNNVDTASVWIYSPLVLWPDKALAPPGYWFNVQAYGGVVKAWWTVNQATPGYIAPPPVVGAPLSEWQAGAPAPPSGAIGAAPTGGVGLGMGLPGYYMAQMPQPEGSPTMTMQMPLANPGYSVTIEVNRSGATLDGTRYVAGPMGGVEDVLKLTDAMGHEARATVLVPVPLTLNPSGTPPSPGMMPALTVRPGERISFTASGGSGTYEWTPFWSGSGSTFDPATGEYVAGTNANPDYSEWVGIRDGYGLTAGVNIKIQP
ncbi:MAG: hypothetical protein AAB229_08705 [Candidatus Hydrogenedentota bacterium]